jgi:hypothetical protein
MPDTFDTYGTDPANVPPLTRAVIAAMPTTTYGKTVGPVLADKAFRALLDELSSLESRVTALGG